jgi:hypothetical protein
MGKKTVSAVIQIEMEIHAPSIKKFPFPFKSERG